MFIDAFHHSLSGLLRLKRHALPTTGLVGAALLAGCMHKGRDLEAEAPLLRRAQFDLSCKEVAITPLGDDEIGTFGARIYAPRGVEGCGRKATYLKPHGELGEWIMNSESPK